MNVLKEIISEDNAAKYLIGLDDGNTVEALYMHDADRLLTYHSTVCVSSQAGCPVGCRFCATGEQGFVRNLTAEEILGQVMTCDKKREKNGLIPLDAVVFAGMGEPLLNADNVFSAIRKIKSTLDLDHFELATVGIVPKIRELADFVTSSGVHLRLNLSLHASTDEKRSMLIPYTRQYGIQEILDAAEFYAVQTGTKIRVRYMLIKGVNDSNEDIANLTRLLAGRPMKLVLSQYNDNNMNGLQSVNILDVLKFYNKMKETIECDIFHNFGGAILGGCGQLRRNEKIS